MTRLRDRSLVDKLRVALLGAVSVGLVAVAALLVASETAQEFVSVDRDGRAATGMVLDQMAPFLQVDAGPAAEASLHSVGRIDGLSAIVVRRADGSIFATYPTTLHQDPATLARLDAYRGLVRTWGLTRLGLWRTVEADGQVLGEVTVEMDFTATWRELAVWVLGAAVAVGTALLIAMLFVRRTQRMLVGPLQRLTEAVREVNHSGRYDLRVEPGYPDEAGELIDGFNRMIREIGQREAELLAHRDRLEDLVEARTAELRQAKDEAEAANRSKGHFLANASHEIRTPINGVLGMAELLAQTPLNDRQQRFVQMLRRSAESLLYLINDVLDFSKIEAGKLQLEAVPFSPEAAVEELALMFAEAAQARGLELVVHIEPQVPRQVIGDPHRFRQVLNNLLSNAVKFTAAGEVRVRLRLETAGDMAPRLICEVDDTGIGIPVEAQARLFQAFAQAETSTARRYGGTGLGLSIARELVELMGGQLAFTSHPGEGSRFGFAIPAAIVEPPARDVDLGGREPMAVVAARQGLREALVSQLLGFGTAVTAFAAPQELFDAGFTGPGWVFLDTPFATDPELLARLAEAGLRGVALVPLREAAMERAALDAGAEACLTKPVLPAELQALLRQAVLRPRPAPAASEAVASGGAQVLLVEDHAVNREIAQAMLTRLGCVVTQACNGREAVHLCASRRFDLVLMDIQMPEMDGIEATRVIRMGETGRVQSPVPIVALTANALKEDREAAFAAGMDDYLTKPVTSARLGQVLLRYLPEAPLPPGPPPAADREQAAGDVDLAILANLPGVDGNLGSPKAARYVGLFLEDGAGLLARLVSALDEGDGEAVRRECHRLKSSSAAVGALALSSLARDMESRVKAGAEGWQDPLYPHRMWQAYRCYHDAVLAAGVALDAASGEPSRKP